VTKLPKADSPQLSESQIQRAILDWLAAKGILAFRMNTGAIKSTYKGKDRFMRFGTPGMADVLVFEVAYYPFGPNHGGFNKVMWLEVKTATGKQSELQKSFQAQVESHGHRYIICRSVEDVEKALA
jgi:hypothetical protein